MALGVAYGSSGAGGEFMAYVSYDSRAGRMSRADRVQDSAGNFQTEKVDVTSTFKAVMDMDNIHVGWMVFTAGAAPQSLMVKIGEAIPQKPNGDWKMGAKVVMKLAANCGGDIREMSSTAASFMRGFDELHDAYKAGAVANPGKLPIVALKTTIPVTTGQGAKKSTNYQPVFEIVGWAPRPADLVAKPAGPAPAPAAVTSAPSTGSTQVGPPKAAAMADADADGFG